MAQRTSYSASFKLKVVTFAETSSSRSVGREIQISEYGINYGINFSATNNPVKNGYFHELKVRVFV